MNANDPTRIVFKGSKELLKLGVYIGEGTILSETRWYSLGLQNYTDGMYATSLQSFVGAFENDVQVGINVFPCSKLNGPDDDAPLGFVFKGLKSFGN